jgi:hypothetical protein
MPLVVVDIMASHHLTILKIAQNLIFELVYYVHHLQEGVMDLYQAAVFLEPMIPILPNQVAGPICHHLKESLASNPSNWRSSRTITHRTTSILEIR